MEDLKNNIERVVVDSNERNQEKNMKNFGGFWMRFASFWLDFLPFQIWMIVMISSTYLVFLYSNYMDDEKSAIILFLIATTAIILFCNIGYNIYLYYKKGTTLGYEILGMKIVSAKTGEKESGWPMTGRWAVKYFVFGAPWIIPAVIISNDSPFVLFIPFLAVPVVVALSFIIGLRKKKQGAHDLALGTVVVMQEEAKKTWVVWVVSILSVAIYVPVIYYKYSFIALVVLTTIYNVQSLLSPQQF